MTRGHWRPQRSIKISPRRRSSATLRASFYRLGLWVAGINNAPVLFSLVLAKVSLYEVLGILVVWRGVAVHLPSSAPLAQALAASTSFLSLEAGRCGVFPLFDIYARRGAAAYRVKTWSGTERPNEAYLPCPPPLFRACSSNTCHWPAVRPPCVGELQSTALGTTVAKIPVWVYITVLSSVAS